MAPGELHLISRNFAARKSSGESGKHGRYEAIPTGLRAMTALVVWRNKAIKPWLAAAQGLRPSLGAQNPSAIDTHYDTIRTAMCGVFQELGLAA